VPATESLHGERESQGAPATATAAVVVVVVATAAAAEATAVVVVVAAATAMASPAGSGSMVPFVATFAENSAAAWASAPEAEAATEPMGAVGTAMPAEGWAMHQA
jgi:hypothetical protein